jgi:two-component system, OmpR family, sensor histidine kinase CreC
LHLGLRVLAGVFLIAGLAAFFVLRIFAHEFKPAVREVMEEVMVDAAYLLADMVSDELAAGRLADGRFAGQLKAYQQRKISASINSMQKETLDFHVYVTNAKGVVVFDSLNKSVGQDFSQWRDVALALKGEYGARATREASNKPPAFNYASAAEPATFVYYVAAPVWYDNAVVGAISVSKPSATVQPFVDRAEESIRQSGRWLIALSLLIGVLATLWLVHAVRRLTRYADEVEAGKRVPLPNVPGELGKLAQGMNRMRERLEGQKNVENTVRALTHELKSPLAAIRGAGELLREPLPDADRVRFAKNVCEQSERMNTLVSRMLELSKLEQTQALSQRTTMQVAGLFAAVSAQQRDHASTHCIALAAQVADEIVSGDEELLQLALSNLLANAIDFSRTNTTVTMRVTRNTESIVLSVEDSGSGFSDFALARAGERFFSTVRPDGGAKGSGLGLAIAQQVALLHGGALRVRNAPVGGCAEIVLPLHTRFT